MMKTNRISLRRLLPQDLKLNTRTAKTLTGPNAAEGTLMKRITVSIPPCLSVSRTMFYPGGTTVVELSERYPTEIEHHYLSSRETKILTLKSSRCSWKKMRANICNSIDRKVSKLATLIAKKEHIQESSLK